VPLFFLYIIVSAFVFNLVTLFCFQTYHPPTSFPFPLSDSLASGAPSSSSPYSYSYSWRTLTDIIAVYIIGILLFAITLVPWTADAQSLYWRAPEAFWRAVVQGAT
jgi:hypothetical protein